MLRRSFRTRIIVLVTVLVLVAQLASFIAVLSTISANVESDARERLALGATLFSRLVASRHAQLLQAVSVLSADFGFKAAVASHDAATIESALENHGSRVHADVSALLTLDGEVIASTLPGAGGDLSRLALRARGRSHLLTAGVLDRTPYLFVLVPLKAPAPVAWVLMGFAIDEPMARELARITGLDVTIQAVGASGSSVISTLAEPPDIDAMRPGAAPGLRFEVERYFTHTHTMPADDGEIRVLLHRSIHEAMLPYRELRLELAILTSIAALAALVVGVLMARGVTRPVMSLVAAARRIRQGDYSRRVDIVDGDELGVLARTLERMQGSIAEREARIVHQATYDELTGLLNRTVAHERIEQILRVARSDGAQLSLLVLGIVRFRQITESLGLGVGDAVLRELAHRLDSAGRSADIIARLDREQFLFLAQDTPPEGAATLAQRLVKVAGSAVRLQQAEINLDVAVGIAAFPEHGADVDTLIRRAEIALGDAKRSSARVEVFQCGRDDRHLRRLSIVGDLKNAVSRDELTVHYQPKIALARPGELHAEALVRWIHPTLGFLPPDEFIELAERSGNIGVLTDWVLAHVIAQIRRWREQGLDVTVSVNLSALDVIDERLPERIAGILRREGVPAGNLALEITESAAMDDTNRSLQVLTRLRAMGHRLAIDDFGTGFSSLAKLKELPVQELKVDKSFVIELAPGSGDETIVRSTIDLAHGMGLSVTAEGVETAEGLALLDAMGCDTVQGYHISRPVPVEDMTRWLEERAGDRPAPRLAPLLANAG